MFKMMIALILLYHVISDCCHVVYIK